MFAFAKGAGVFAEAGPEAIMPLTRTANGKLGVMAVGGGGGAGLSATSGGGAAQISVSVTLNSDGSSKTETNTPGLEQFGKDIGAFVDTRYRKLLSMDLRPDGAIGRAMIRR